uniref:Cilia- and flagella-associated protein 69 ARM repeats domain-containing protein n=1 Tax=Phytophthora ramorum TaxID=164328 RepID=H3HBI6_PHYRM
MSRRFLTPASTSHRASISAGDSSCFQKLFASAGDPQTRNNHARHLALAKNILYENELGWKVAELPLVGDLLQLLRNKVQDGAPQFSEQLVLAVMRCCKPFIRQKSNEEITNPSLFHGILPTLGELLSFEDIDVQVAAAEALRTFATGECLARRTPKTRSNNVETKSDDLRLTPRIFSQNLMEETGTVEAIVGDVAKPEEGGDSRPASASETQQANENGDTVEEQLVRVIGNALPIQMRLSVLLFPLVDLLYELSAYQRCGEVLVVSGALHYVVFILDNISNPQDELLPLCLEILWNVLELSHEQMSTVTKCASRKELLEVFRLRNAMFFLGNEFTFQSLLHVLELLLAHGYRQQDKEMRNECLMILQLLSKRRRSMDFFYSTASGETQQDKSSATASAITASNQYYATNSDEDFEFKQMLWFLLAEISCDHQANLSELVQFRFLEVWLSYATASNGSVNQQQDSSLSVLNHVAPFAVESFYEVGGHSKLLEFLELNMGNEDVICRNDDGSNRKRFRQANGVHSLIQHLEFDPSHSVLEENILIGIVDAVRSCVIGDLDNETAFINADGVPKLLSILVSAPKAIKHQVLAALAEICVNPAAIPSYQMWRCDQPGENNNAGANQLLLRIYADEETAEKRSNQDEINQDTTSTNSPSNRPESPAFARLKEALKAAQGLTSGKQSTRSILQLEGHQIHPDVNLKAKIYSILANVSFACEAESLTPQDQVMLEIAREYPTFKLGEMWQHVERELHAEGVRPIYADSLYIRKNIEHAYNTSVCTKLAQQEVFANLREQSTAREGAFFDQILRQKQQEAQAEEFHRANRRQNSTMQLHMDAKKTRLEFMRRQDPAAFAAYESEERCLIRDPPPEYVDKQEGFRALQQNEAELRGRLTTITRSRKHSISTFSVQILQNLIDTDHTGSMLGPSSGSGCLDASLSRIFSINTADV